MEEIEKLREYLRWLITPQDKSEEENFDKYRLCDSIIDLGLEINSMNKEKLYNEIDKQLEHLNLVIERK